MPQEMREKNRGKRAVSPSHGGCDATVPMGCSSTNDTYGIDLWSGLAALDDSRVSIPWGAAPGWYETRLRRFIALENDRSALAQMYKVQGTVRQTAAARLTWG